MHRRASVTQFQQDRTGGGEIPPQVSSQQSNTALFGEWAVSVGLHTATVAQATAGSL